MDELVQGRLKELIEESGISYRENTQSWIFVCPRCQKKDKLYIRKRDGRFVCFVCAEGEGHFRGAPEFAVAELFGWSVDDTKRKLYGDNIEGKTVDELLDIQLYDYYGEDDPILEDVTSTLPTLTWPEEYYSIGDPKAIRGLQYLEGRGIPQPLAEMYGLRYCPPQRRVIFPVEVSGRLIGWQARSIIPTEWYDDEGRIHTMPKIVGNKGLRREVALMFGDRLKGSEHAVICEGPIDGIKAHMCGGNAVTMGKAVSDAQIEAIRRSGVKSVYLALDPDAASEMDRLCHALGDKELYQLLPPGRTKDLGEMTPMGVFQRFVSAPRVGPETCFVYLRYR